MSAYIEAKKIYLKVFLTVTLAISVATSGCKTTKALRAPDKALSAQAKDFTPKDLTNAPYAVLAWDQSPGQVDGYRLYSGTASRAYNVTNQIPGQAVTLFTTGALAYGSTNYFALTAYLGNLESDFSAEVSYVAPFPAPSGLRLVTITVQATTNFLDWRNVASLPLPASAPHEFYRVGASSR